MLKFTSDCLMLVIYFLGLPPIGGTSNNVWKRRSFQSPHLVLHHYKYAQTRNICVQSFLSFDTYDLSNMDHYIHWFETFSCLKLIYGSEQHGLMFGSSNLNHLDMSSYLGSWYEHPLQSICILQHSPIFVWFIHVLIFVTVSKCQKIQINEYSDMS